MKSCLRIGIAFGILLLKYWRYRYRPLWPRALSERYLPHRFCYLAQPWLIWTNAPADMPIFLSYVVLFESLFLLAWLVRSQLRPYLWIFLAFGLFILTCGLTHFMEVVTIWWPLYPLLHIRQNTLRASVRAHRNCLPKKSSTSFKRDQSIPARNAHQPRSAGCIRTTGRRRQTFRQHQSRNQ